MQLVSNMMVFTYYINRGFVMYHLYPQMDIKQKPSLI